MLPFWHPNLFNWTGTELELWGFWGLCWSWARTELSKEWISGYWFSTTDWLKTSVSSRVSLAWRLPVLGSAEWCSVAIGPFPHSSVWHKPLPLHRNTPHCSTDARRGPVQHGNFKYLNKALRQSWIHLCFLLPCSYYLLLQVEVPSLEYLTTWTGV